MSGRRPESFPPFRVSRLRSLWVAAFFLALIFAPFAACAEEEEQPELSDPCPAIMEMMAGKTPDDLSMVQADIDRYTLCARRAELLKKLNEISVENEKAVKDSMGFGGALSSNPGMTLGSAPVLPPTPPLPPLAPMPGEPGGVPAGFGGDDGNWKILEVFGAAGNLQAKIAKGDGAVARVKAGSSLPGGGTVAAITPVRVVIRDSGGETELSWRE